MSGSGSGTALSAEHVTRLARLARLELTDAETGAMQRDLGAILAYIERLRALPLEGVEPVASVSEPTNRLGEDVPGPTLPPGAAPSMAPERLGPFVRVPKVLDDGGGA